MVGALGAVSMLHIRDGKMKMENSEIQSISSLSAWALPLCSIAASFRWMVKAQRHTQTFPLLDVPEGELILRETVAINEIGMTVEWEEKRKKGREQMGDTNEV